MLKHSATGFKGEMVEVDKGVVATLAKKGIITIVTSNGIRFSAPVDQFKQDLK